MAIRKDIDDMLNNLKSGKPLESPKKDPKPIPKLSDNKIDKMSVDELLSSLTADKDEKKSVSETLSSESKPKKKITISHKLPDYEAIRAENQQKEERHLEAEMKAEKKAAEDAEKARIEAEKKAAEDAEKARIEAEKKAAEDAEKARIEAEKKAAEDAEKARIEAEKKAAEDAEKARIEAEKKAAEDAEKARIEAEKKAAENAENVIQSDKFSEEAIAVYSDAEIDEAENIEKVHEKKIRLKNKKTDNLKVSEDIIDKTDNHIEKKTNKFTSALKNILDEDPQEIINQRKEQFESDDKPPKGRVKKGFYAIFGVIFALLACVGLITVIAKGINMFDSYTSGESRKEGFESVLYPAVIMDIESFNSPSELSSEQIITAAIWSMIMKDGVTEQYELTFDVVIIPAADVESYAVKLFGDELPKLEHTTVGPAESRFYYNEETKSYNVPVAPVTYTYSPEIREASKSGNEYIVLVDYIDELPSWLPKTSSKSVQYVLTEINGSYQIKSMKILSTNTNAI